MAAAEGRGAALADDRNVTPLDLIDRPEAAPRNVPVAEDDVRPLSVGEVLTKREVAARLRVSVRKVEDLHPPCLDLGRTIWPSVQCSARC